MTNCEKCKAVISYGTIEKRFCQSCYILKIEQENKVLKNRKVGRPEKISSEKKIPFVLMIAPIEIELMGGKEKLKELFYEFLKQQKNEKMA